jgi:predicted ATPase
MLINRLILKKILSFNDSTIELGPLNVLIGPNAVGKSNLIEVIGLLQAAPTSLSAAILRGGGVRQWLWLADRTSPTASIQCEVNVPRGEQTVTYELQFADSNGLAIIREQVAKAEPNGASSQPYLTRSFNQTVFRPDPSVQSPPPYGAPPGDSALSQFKHPSDPTPVTEVGNQFAQIRIYREFRTGIGSGARNGIPTTVPKDALADGGDNLALVLLDLDFLGVYPRIRVYLQRFCERFEDVKLNVSEGLARAYLREAGLAEMVSAARMSDGTLKFLSILAALFHPKPPPLMCIEEPETGLHPDALQLVAEALLEASQSMQLIVTTHSDALIDSLTDRPDTVLVCERDFDNGTQMKRLSKEDLEVWLERYTLGQLWRKGEIGGGRW